MANSPLGNQVCDKYVPLEVVLQDSSLRDWYGHDKLERESFHSWMRALFTAMEKVFDKPTSRSFMPLDTHINVIESMDEQRVVVKNGVSVVVSSDSEDVKAIVAPSSS